MLEFLVHKCIKDADEIERPEVRKRYGFFSSIVGIICNVILFASKLAIGLIAGSISIVSDGVNNLSDCATCIVTMFGYKMAAKPADRDHPFGHGRMEYLTSLVIAAAVVAVGFELLRSSVEKVMHPERVTFSFLALLVLVLSMLVKIGMGVMNRKLGTKLSSSIMLATSKDSFSDVFATLATTIALVMSAFSDLPMDGIMGIVVSVMIMLSGFGIVKDTADKLYYLSVCAIFKNEGPILKEWIEYHLLVGVDHFFLYNNFSDDNYREILAPYIERGIVDLIDWPVPQGQFPAYEDCWQKFRETTRWIALIDLNEFLCDNRTCHGSTKQIFVLIYGTCLYTRYNVVITELVCNIFYV